MQLEFDVLQANNTWTLQDHPLGAWIITGKWVFKHKWNPDDTLDRYKARWVVHGFNQRPEIDFGEIFLPIETVYCSQPTGFEHPERPNVVCLLSRSLYGLRQGPRQWFLRFVAYVTSLGFVQSHTDSSLFVLRHSADTMYLLLYIDAMILSASSSRLLQHIIAKLKLEFAIKDLGPLWFFHGIDVQRDDSGFFLSQEKYAKEILEQANLSNCKAAGTPADVHPKTSDTDGNLINDTSWHRSMAGALQYLTLTRPDIAYAVQQMCLHMHAARDAHLTLLKRILRYVKGTTSLGLRLLPVASLKLTAYTDTDWAGCPDTRCSTSGFLVFLGESLASWSSKRQATVLHSSIEAKYRGVANVIAECSWLRQLLGELHYHIQGATIAYCDNVSSVYMARNPVHHQRTKHIELDVHFVREKVALGELRVL
ncbi:uncharacterized mitochondrial protein AtMg00810-like [Miscanthus floridulus]|uniref:uncharacterized mitochondrial protein AtMg00810-like n=1 Tax=Miscanthus floridulus TaxID=154761 RepID=UPI00345A8920